MLSLGLEALGRELKVLIAFVGVGVVAAERGPAFAELTGAAATFDAVEHPFPGRRDPIGEGAARKWRWPTCERRLVPIAGPRSRAEGAQAETLTSGCVCNAPER